MSAKEHPARPQAGKRIAYVLSMKGGLPSFNHREISDVVARGYQVHIFPTKVTEGLYRPKEEWPVHRPSAARASACFFYWLFRRPSVLLGIVREASRNKAFPEMLLAAQYALEMKRAGISLVHCHFADRKMFTTNFCSRLSGVPYTVTVHSHELVFYADRPLFRKALEMSSKIITVCDYNRDFLIEKHGLPPEKIETIRLALPLDRFAKDSRMKVLTVAKFEDYKGYDVLVETARRMKDDPVVFWVVGDGPIDVRGMASDMVRSGKVVILGSVSEEVLRILYQCCDVFCLPSKTAPSGQKEGIPVSIMEAMASGKPVVSTYHAGIPELVEKVLVPEGSPDELAASLRTYMTDVSRRDADGARNAAIVRDKHGPSNLEALISVFEAAMSSR